MGLAAWRLVRSEDIDVELPDVVVRLEANDLDSRRSDERSGTSGEVAELCKADHSLESGTSVLVSALVAESARASLCSFKLEWLGADWLRAEARRRLDLIRRAIARRGDWSVALNVWVFALVSVLAAA